MLSAKNVSYACLKNKSIAVSISSCISNYMHSQIFVKTCVLWLTVQNPFFKGWSLTWRTPLCFFQRLWAIWEFLHELCFPWWPEMTWINYDALCGKHCLKSVLPHFSLLIYWPPTPLFSFCSCPNFPISSICFKIKKLLFGRQYKRCTSTDVFSVSARSGHTLMRFCLAPFLVWRDWHCMNIFILLLSSFLSFFFFLSTLMTLW